MTPSLAPSPTPLPATAVPAASPHPGMGFKQFVSLIAALMAVNALGIDTMLPALPAIGRSLHIPNENQAQLVITAYLLGFGVAQIVYGTLADRFGRKPVLLAGLSVYIIFTVLAAFSDTFEVMVVSRVLQGLGSAVTRVLTVSIVRDCYSGRPMARVMSLSFIVFLAVPIVAPSIGQAIVFVAPWRVIFGFLAVFASAVLVWVILRLPETLHPDDRTTISPAHVFSAFRFALTNRISVGYMLAMSMILGGMFGFINSAQQVFVDVFRTPRMFTLIFACIAFFVGLAAVINARFVGRYGTRMLSHGALLGFVTISAIHVAVSLSGYETLLIFTIIQASKMFCFGLVLSNFSSMAMEPLGHIAGTAASVQGFVTTLVGALVGFFIGQHFDGTDIPMLLGFLCCGSVAFLIVLITEKGRLFRPTETGLMSVGNFAH
jgi:DHA1 family bicyclomycin/chloramphenicol resistance-like MFS transporter